MGGAEQKGGAAKRGDVVPRLRVAFRPSIIARGSRLDHSRVPFGGEKGEII